MGEKQNQAFQLSFNSSLRVDFQGSRVTLDHDLDEAEIARLRGVTRRR